MPRVLFICQHRCSKSSLHVASGISQKPCACSGWGRRSSTESSELWGAWVQSWLRCFSLCPKGKMLIHHHFPPVQWMLFIQSDVFVSILESTYFVWPCNYRKYRCRWWLRHILCDAHVPGCLVMCAPEPSHNCMIFSLYKNNFTNTHPLHDCRNFCQREPRAGKVPSGA